MQLRHGVLNAAAWLALGLGAGLPLGGAAGDTLYSYVDERGVIHYTNIPNDRRYVAVRHLGGPETWRPRVTDRFDALIRRQAEARGLPPALVKAVIAAESNFDPRAVSPKGAQGLMQLMPATAREVGVRNAFRAEENVRGGTLYLSRMIRRYGDYSRALAAYNAGPRAVDRHRGVPPYRETRQYVERVLTYYRRYDVDFAP